MCHIPMDDVNANIFGNDPMSHRTVANGSHHPHKGGFEKWVLFNITVQLSHGIVTHTILHIPREGHGLTFLGPFTIVVFCCLFVLFFHVFAFSLPRFFLFVFFFLHRMPAKHKSSKELSDKQKISNAH